MEIAIVGLGRMGKGIALRLKSKGHDVLAWNRSAEPREEVKAKGCRVVEDHMQIAAHLKAPRIVWVMLPAGDVTDQMIQDMVQILSPGDILIDGGNSHYKDTLRHNAIVGAKGIHFIDVGVSGGLIGAEQGYCTMAGGEQAIFDRIVPILHDMSIDFGFAHCGPIGSGHYTKMVHNAIEYAQMQAIAESFDLLKNGYFKGDLKLPEIAELWRHGTIISGTLMDCTAAALKKDPQLARLEPYIEDNGEGKWTIQEALDHGVPFLMTSHALFSRYLSRDKDKFAYKIVAAQRNEFGGHRVFEKSG
jgi:6-phosphogluconate dehydrogenase